jgi:hypothetical protein
MGGGFLQFPENLFERFLIFGFLRRPLVNPVKSVFHRKLRRERITFNESSYAL